MQSLTWTKTNRTIFEHPRWPMSPALVVQLFGTLDQRPGQRPGLVGLLKEQDRQVLENRACWVVCVVAWLAGNVSFVEHCFPRCQKMI